MFDDEQAGEQDVRPLEPDLTHDEAATPARSRRPAATRRPWTLAATRQRVLVATVAVVATTLVAGLFAWNAGRPASGQIAAASQPGSPASVSPGASGGPTPSGGTAPATAFEPLIGSSATPVARLTARGASGAIVPLDAGFRLESVDGTPASTLAKRLTVEPAVALTVTKEAGDRAVLLAPVRPLTAGTVYRFALAGDTGQLLDTWAFQAKQPLRVVGTLPETHSSEVPLDTGIEVTFDQDGVVDAASHVSIEPATAGRFEQHGRTLAFVPDRPLTPTTVYSVTVTRGVAVGGTGEATIVDTRFQFETAARTSGEEQRTYEFPEEVTESATAARATIGIWSYGGEKKAPATTRIAVYRLAGLDAAIAAYRSLRARPDWTRWSSTGLVDVTRLTRVLSADLPLNPYRNGFWVRLPERLPAGWYLVQQADGTKPIQTVLQVTDVAGYLAVSDTKTIVWANDVATRRPLVGATASSDGVRFGTTDARGLAMATTPKSLLPTAGDRCDRPCDPVVVVRTSDGRRVFLPLSAGHDKLDGYGGSYWWSDADPRTWSLLHTDRGRYRPGDTVNLWGYARDRSSGAAPAAVTIRLSGSGGDDSESGAPPVATVIRPLDGAGAFHAAIPLTGLPDGYYSMTVAIGTRVIRTTAITVGPIAKPAYQLDVTTGRRVYIAGDQVKVTVGARFFEGTPVPGVPLRLEGLASGSATTDSLGSAVWRTVAAVAPDEDQSGPASATIEAMPARAEEAEITAASREVVVFPSSRTIDAVGRIANGRVVATGSLHLVAVNRLEAQIAGGRAIWDLDPRGAAVRNATVNVRFTELVPNRRQVGTEYDFIEKKVVPVYQYDLDEIAAGSARATTGADGSWTASVPASRTDHAYRIDASAGDPDGHVARTSASAGRSGVDPYAETASASLERSTPSVNENNEFGVGQRIDIRLTDPDLAQTSGDGTRYLFFQAQRGIRTATVQASRRYLTTFPSWGPPNMSIGGVRFTGTGYVGTVWYGATFRASDRRLQVDLATDAPRYAPGQTVTVRVRTRSATGAPVAATVFLRAIDEKLFSIGAAGAEDPLAALYVGIGNGVVDTYRSHRNPEGQFEGGDTTGGGGDERDDFRDSLLFEAVTTGADGRASTSFKLSDDLTSWRVTASAVTRRLQAGAASVLVPVGLPFFVDASIAPEYLAADRPTIAVRTFGSAVEAGAPVTIRVTSASLGLDSGPLAARAFANVDVPLPALRVGSHSVTITATAGSGGAARTDRLTRTFTVVDTRLTRQRSSYVELPATGPFRGGDGFTTVLVADASGGRYLSLLTDLTGVRSGRLDRALAADLAATLLKERFGVDEVDPNGEAVAAERYMAADDGLAVVPYSSSDLELSALVAIVAPDRFDRTKLAFYLRTFRDDPSETRERRMYALAGLAGLGEPVLPLLRAAAADPALTVREQLMLGLGAASLGDAATARSILDRLVAGFGEQAGTLARLRVGTSAADITAGTATAAALAAAVGSPLAARFWAYVEGNPAKDRIEVLTAIAFVTHALDHQPVQAARIAWTVDGTRHVVALGTGESLRLELTAAQLAALSIERLSGTIGVTTRWREDVEPAAFTPDPDVTMTRSVLPASPVKAADLVVVELHVTFSAQAANGCRQVTELVPSGLAPVGAGSRWIDEADEPLPDDGVVLPYDQTGSRVSFCVGPNSRRRAFTLRYVARVVTPGTYAWEPAVAQSASDEAIANLTPATSITIR